jgi:hypothetical protein
MAGDTHSLHVLANFWSVYVSQSLVIHHNPIRRFERYGLSARAIQVTDTMGRVQ